VCKVVLYSLQGNFSEDYIKGNNKMEILNAEVSSYSKDVTTVLVTVRNKDNKEVDLCVQV